MILPNVQAVVSQQARGAQDVKMNGTAKGNNISVKEHFVGTYIPAIEYILALTKNLWHLANTSIYYGEGVRQDFFT